MPTYIIIALNVAFYVYTSILGGNFLEINMTVLYTYGQVGGCVFAGAYYQLITSMFVHATLTHLVGNMLFLFIFGTRSEKIFSLPEYLTIYFLGGLAGNLLSLVLLNPWVAAVGASGAIFSIFGAYIIYQRKAFRQSLAGAFCVRVFYLISQFWNKCEQLAHLGGLGLGLLLGYLFASKRKPAVQYNINYSYGNQP
jgi:rhomboid protease GluP